MTRSRLSFGLMAGLAVVTVRAGAVPQQTIFSSSVVGVRVDVLVTDHGKPVPGLTAAEFELRDNGVPQRIELLESADLPVNTVLALDTSNSTTGPRRAELVAASHALLDGLIPGDRSALTTFSHAVVPRVPLTEDARAVKAALDAITPVGDTSVMDGIYVALMATQAEAGRSIVVVCTDGRDTASWLEPDEVLEAANRSNAVIYVVAADRARRWSTLSDLTEATGGRTIDIAPNGDLRAELQAILREFRSRYVLTYVPTGVPVAGFHRLDVRVKRSGLAVKARPGYFGAGK
jgi:VWFA-related protein